MPRVWSNDYDRSEQSDSGPLIVDQTRRGSRFSWERVRQFAKRFAPGLRPRRNRHQCSIRRVAQGRSGVRDQRRETKWPIDGRRLRERSLVRRPGVFPLARIASVKIVNAGSAKLLPRVYHLAVLEWLAVSDCSEQ